MEFESDSTIFLREVFVANANFQLYVYQCRYLSSNIGNLAPISKNRKAFNVLKIIKLTITINDFNFSL